MNLTVVGLGIKCGDLTINGQSAIMGADLVLVRTNQSIASSILHKLKLKVDNIESFDAFYDLAEDFDHLNKLIVDRIAHLAEDYKNIVYCVDGDGVSDSSVEMLMKRFAVTVIPGIAEASYRVPSSCAVSVTATALLASKICIDTSLPLIVTQIDNPLVAGNVKLCLLGLYGFDAACALTVGQKKVQLALEDIDRQKKYGYSTTLYIAAQSDSEKERFCVGDLLRLVAQTTRERAALSACGGLIGDRQHGGNSEGDNKAQHGGNGEGDGVDCLYGDEYIEKLEYSLLVALEDIDSAERSGEVEFCDIVSGIGAKLNAVRSEFVSKTTSAPKNLAGGEKL